MNLEELRVQIDRIDRQIVELYVQRMETVSRISAYKREHGLAVYDPARENVLLERVAGQAGPRYAEDVRRLFRILLTLSKEAQERERQDGI